MQLNPSVLHMETQHKVLYVKDSDLSNFKIIGAQALRVRTRSVVETRNVVLIEASVHIILQASQLSHCKEISNRHRTSLTTPSMRTTFRVRKCYNMCATTLLLKISTSTYPWIVVIFMANHREGGSLSETDCLGQIRQKNQFHNFQRHNRRCLSQRPRLHLHRQHSNHQRQYLKLRRG